LAEVQRFIEAHGIEADAEVCAIAIETEEFCDSTVTFTIYDLREGRKYLDDNGEPAVYQRSETIQVELPAWWAKASKPVSEAT
jgi:hypothetical protein